MTPEQAKRGKIYGARCARPGCARQPAYCPRCAVDSRCWALPPPTRFCAKHIDEAIILHIMTKGASTDG